MVPRDGFPILRDLATRTQVFLFTHHRHLVELARSALPGEGVHYHALSSAHGQP